MEQFAPPVESYLPTKTFKHALGQKEKDFAQLVAVGSPPAEAILKANILQPDPDLTQRDYYTAASRLLRSPAIQERIEHYRTIHSNSMAITAERILQEQAAMAFSDFAQLFDLDGRPIRNPHEIPRHVRASVKEWTFTKDGEFKPKMYDKQKALQFLADIEGITDESNRSKAPQINISIGDGNVSIDGSSPSRPPRSSRTNTNHNQDTSSNDEHQAGMTLSNETPDAPITNSSNEAPEASEEAFITLDKREGEDFYSYEQPEQPNIEDMLK